MRASRCAPLTVELRASVSDAVHRMVVQCLLLVAGERGCDCATLRLLAGFFPALPSSHPSTPLPRRGPPPCRSAMGRQTKPKGVDPKLGAPELIKRLQVNRARTLPPRRQNTPRQPSRNAKSLAISGAQPHAGGSARPLSLSIHQGFWPWHRGAGGALLRWATRVRCATVCACRPMPTNGAERGADRPPCCVAAQVLSAYLSEKNQNSQDAAVDTFAASLIDPGMIKNQNKVRPCRSRCTVAC